MGRFTPLGQLLVSGIVVVLLLVMVAIVLTQFGQDIGCAISGDCAGATVEATP